MPPEPVALTLYTPCFLLLRQESTPAPATQESAAAQVPSRPIDAPRAREREASIPPWVFFLLIPVFFALVALILLRQRGYNPHRRLDLRKQPEGARYRERIAPPPPPVEPATGSGESDPDKELAVQTDFPSPRAPRFREEEDRDELDFADLAPISAAEDEGIPGEDSDSASELFRDESGELAIEEFGAATDRPEMDFLQDEARSREELEPNEPTVATAVAAESDELVRWKAERLEWEHQRESLLSSIDELKEAHAAELAVGDEKRSLLQSELELSEGRLAEERQHRERLHSELERALSAADDHVRRREELQAAVVRLESELKEQVLRNETLAAELETMKAEWSSLRDQARRDADESRQLSQALAAARVECDDLRQKLAAMDEDLQYRDEKCNQMSEQARKAEESCTKLHQEMQALNDALASSKAKLDEQERLAAAAGGLTYGELLDKLNEKRKLVRLLQDKLREKLVELAVLKKKAPRAAPGGHAGPDGN